MQTHNARSEKSNSRPFRMQAPSSRKGMMKHIMKYRFPWRKVGALSLVSGEHSSENNLKFICNWLPTALCFHGWNDIPRNYASRNFIGWLNQEHPKRNKKFEFHLYSHDKQDCVRILYWEKWKEHECFRLELASKSTISSSVQKVEFFKTLAWGLWNIHARNSV